MRRPSTKLKGKVKSKPKAKAKAKGKQSAGAEHTPAKRQRAQSGDEVFVDSDAEVAHAGCLAGPKRVEAAHWTCFVC